MTRHETDRTSRREFVKQSTAATIGAGLLGTLGTTTAARAYAGGDDTIRVGLIGCGGRGTGAAREALNTSGSVRLVAMGDAFADRMRSSLQGIRRAVGEDRAPTLVTVDEDHMFAGFDAYQKVIDSDVDLVILATPPGFRPIHFEAAVNAGKHVFMEKPVAVDAPGVRQVIQAIETAKQKNLKVGVGLQRHHEARYLETIQRIHDGAIGDVVALRVYWNGGGVWEPRRTREQCRSEMEYQMHNWYYYNWLSGDHIVEQHIHNLDVGNWVKQAYPVKCNGMGGREVRVDPRYGEIFDHHYVEFEYADGSRMYSQCRHIPNCWNSVSEHAHGTRGTANIGGGTLSDGGGSQWRYDGPNPNPYQVEHDNLFAAIREDNAFNEAEFGAYSTLTAIMGRMATYSGKEVTWEAALNSDLNLMPATFDWDAEPPTLPDENGVYPVPVPGVTRAV